MKLLKLIFTLIGAWYEAESNNTESPMERADRYCGLDL
jgi:hypothetical protein